jgi:hypothetical protein
MRQWVWGWLPAVSFARNFRFRSVAPTGEENSDGLGLRTPEGRVSPTVSGRMHSLFLVGRARGKTGQRRASTMMDRIF